MYFDAACGVERHWRNLKKIVHSENLMFISSAPQFLLSANDYGLFRVEDDPTKCVWMENGRTLEYYLIRNGVKILFRKKSQNPQILGYTRIQEQNSSIASSYFGWRSSQNNICGRIATCVTLNGLF